MEFNQQFVVEVLFAASAIIAGIVATARVKVLPRVLSLATSVCLAAAAFFVQASDIIAK